MNKYIKSLALCLLASTQTNFGMMHDSVIPPQDMGQPFKEYQCLQMYRAALTVATAWCNYVPLMVLVERTNGDDRLLLAIRVVMAKRGCKCFALHAFRCDAEGLIKSLKRIDKDEAAYEKISQYYVQVMDTFDVATKEHIIKNIAKISTCFDEYAKVGVFLESIPVMIESLEKLVAFVCQRPEYTQETAQINEFVQNMRKPQPAVTPIGYHGLQDPFCDFKRSLKRDGFKRSLKKDGWYEK